MEKSGSVWVIKYGTSSFLFHLQPLVFQCHPFSFPLFKGKGTDFHVVVLWSSGLDREVIDGALIYEGRVIPDKLPLRAKAEGVAQLCSLANPPRLPGSFWAKAEL